MASCKKLAAAAAVAASAVAAVRRRWRLAASARKKWRTRTDRIVLVARGRGLRGHGDAVAALHGNSRLLMGRFVCEAK